jgi:hypothetical protein
MRRISAGHAKPGMKLTRPVYDNAGMLLFHQASVLGDDDVNKLLIYGVHEIIISDPRVDDVPVQPLVAPEVEAAVGRAVRDLIYETPPGSPLEPMLLRELEKPVFGMAREFFPEVLGEANVSGGSTDDDYRFMRTAKVAASAMFLGRKGGMSMIDVAQTGLAAVLMDVSQTRWESPDLADFAGANLNPSEVARREPSVSVEMLQAAGGVHADVLTAVAQHHERWDGSGYPAGLAGQAISLQARILGLCDAFFDLVSALPGRPRAKPHEAGEFLMASSGDLFDPELVEEFIHMIPLYPTGITVGLNTGEVGIVSNGNLGFVGRPIVRVILDERGKVVPYDLDLAALENLGKLVTQVMDF